MVVQGLQADMMRISNTWALGGISLSVNCNKHGKSGDDGKMTEKNTNKWKPSSSVFAIWALISKYISNQFNILLQSVKQCKFSHQTPVLSALNWGEKLCPKKAFLRWQLWEHQVHTYLIRLDGWCIEFVRFFFFPFCTAKRINSYKTTGGGGFSKQT